MRQHLSFSYVNPLRERFGQDYFKTLITEPGVYFMRDGRGAILYIGKAKSLRARLSNYAAAKPGTAADHTLEMLESVRSIDWEICASEEAALERENELLHAVRPPYNIAHTESEHYLYIGVRADSAPGGFIGMDFRLNSHPEIASEGFVVYGGFKQRRRVKAGYTALMRLIYASTLEGRRFSYPAKICRTSPPWVYSTRFPKDWGPLLHGFLGGQSIELLQTLVERLLVNEAIPAFMIPSLQDDVERVKRFFEFGPKATLELVQRSGLKIGPLSHSQMDALILSTVKKAVKSQRRARARN